MLRRLILAGLVGGAVMASAGVHAARAIVYCADASPEGFDPNLWDSASTNNATNQMFQGLLAFRRGSTELVPQLATSWQMAPDARSVTFTLRRNVQFHTMPYFTPTRAFNADDVMFTLQRWLDPQLPFNRAFPAAFLYPQSLGLSSQIVGVDRLGDYEVRIRLRNPNASFLSYLAMGFAGIHSAEYAAQLLRQGRASDINNYPIGTGPFRFRSYKKDDVLRMDAHPAYWGAPQRTAKLIYSISREPNVRVQKLRLGECHITAPLRDVDLATLEGRPGIVIQKIQALNISYLGYNLRKAPTDQRLVREALDIAIDRNALFRVLFPRGDATQAVSAFPPVIPGYNKSLRNEFDPARARTLLAQAGYPNGVDIDLWALPVVRAHNPNGQLMAQLIQQDWARIGVRATIKTFEWGEYLKRAAKGEHNVYMSGWSGESGDADDFLAANLTCAMNKTGVKFCNKEFDALVEAGRANPDPEKRKAAYEQAQVIFKRERPWSPIAHSAVYIPMVRELQGFVMSPNGSVAFENVTLLEKK